MTSSRADETLLATGFESGTLCEWSVLSEGAHTTPPPAISTIVPQAGGPGTEITIEGPRLGHPNDRIFLVGGNPGAPAELELEITLRESERLVATLGPAPAAGLYDVVVETCHTSVTVPQGFEIRQPSNLRFEPRFVEPGGSVVMTGSYFGTTAGSVVIGGLPATILSWQDDRVELVLSPSLYPNGPRDVEVSNSLGTMQLPDALVVVGLDDGDEQGPRLAGAVATSNTTVIAQFNEAVLGGPEGAENASLYRITAPPGARTPTVVVLSAELLPPGYSQVRLTTMSQSDLTYTLQVSGIEDLAGNPMAPPDILVDPGRATFVGIPPDGIDTTDSDGDGLTDAAEQSGWSVTVRRTNGTTSTVHVTSDPGDPRLPPDHPINVAARDTDGDGVLDIHEKEFGCNPRSRDTDTDTLSDFSELNEIFSDPTDQDSDSDSYDDGLEFRLFQTSPILSDTDGDQLSDDTEIALGNRNPRIADLPSPTIEVSEARLELDVRFVESNSVQTSELDSKTVSSTLTQSASQQVSNTNSNTQEAFAKLGLSQEFEVSASLKDAGVKSTTGISIETGWSGSWTSSHTASSSEATQRAYQDSLTTQATETEGSTVSRQVTGARMQVALSLKATRNLAYTIRNLQVTALMQDPQDPSSITPVATLLPDAEPEQGFNLGPLSPERGPFILSSDTVFPQLIEELMRNPRGLIYEISNFDITDELGRNFAFTSQDILDRTATLVIDNGSFDSDGDGTGDLTQYHRVATGTGRVIDTNGDGIVDENDRRVVFGENGRHVGITLAAALDALGLERLDEQETPTASLSEEELESSYSVLREGDQQVERIYRIGRNAKDGVTPKSWEVISPTGIEYRADLADYVLETESDLKLAFVQDLDRDRLTDGLEFLDNCSDLIVDTDEDTLDDRFEVLIGWDVETGRGTVRAYGSCSTGDSDGDGLTDAEEAPSLFTYEDREPGDPPLIRAAMQDPTDGDLDGRPDDFVTNPSNADTDGDGLSDGDEVNGFEMTLRSGQVIVVKTDPNNPDTDGDTASDGVERVFGGDPTVPDLDNFADDDGDGLVNIVERDGWTIEIETISIAPSQCSIRCDPGLKFSFNQTSDPMVADTDFDGLLDGEERQLGTNPREKDTDVDGLDDAQEVLGIMVRDLGIVTLDPNDQDTDDDKLPDGLEAELTDVETERWIVRVAGEDPYRVFSDPLQADADFDTLVDGDERLAGSDPTKANTDGDSRDDATEVATGTNPLIEDFVVTVRYQTLSILDDCDSPDSQAGDYFFDLGVVTPNGQFRSAVRSTCAVYPGQAFPLTVCNQLAVPACSEPLDPDQNYCRAPSGLVQLQTFSAVPLQPGFFDVTFGVTALEEFALAGEIWEVDAVVPPALPWEKFRLDDRFTANLEVDGTPRTGFFTGDELSRGTITGTFKKSNPCGLDLQVSISVDK